MEKTAIFMFGLPCSGKSTWINNFLSKCDVNVKLVSADTIKAGLSNYNPVMAYLVHQESVDLAKEEMIKAGNNGEECILMDGGGINNRYTKSIMEEMKKLGYTIKLVYLNTPLAICLERNQERIDSHVRSVPKEEIIRKSNMLVTAYHNIIDLVDDLEVVNYYQDKHVFVDMDGVVAAYQTLQRDEFGNVDFVNNNVFKYAPPVRPVIEKLRADQLDGKKIYILSASANSICNEEKLYWLNKYMAFVNPNDVYFVGNKDYKIVMLVELMKKLKIDKRDCVLIDDWHKTIEQGIKEGIKVIHPSNYLAIDLNK
jgi:predicted ABC-type ATPase